MLASSITQAAEIFYVIYSYELLYFKFIHQHIRVEIWRGQKDSMVDNFIANFMFGRFLGSNFFSEHNPDFGFSFEPQTLRGV
jgi:hypothetical protein